MTRRILLPAVLLAAFGSPATLAQPAPPRISVGPNMLVSRDGDFPHVELQVAANPKDAKNLVGGAITYTRPEGGLACRAYATLDGGATWKASEFEPQNTWGGGDPYVAFTPQGTAVFCALTMAKDEKGQVRGFLHVWRSEDGGLSWGDMSDLGYSYDFQKMTADPTTGRFAGRLYIAALHGYPEYLVSVFRSEDDGRTWKGPVQAVSGRGEIGVGALNAIVLSDGTLVLPIVEYEFKPDKTERKGKVWRPMSLVLSTDGGVSFGPQRKAPAALWDMDDPAWRRTAGNAQFAADTSSAAYRDRIYMVWQDSRHGRFRLLFARSSNRGANWSEPTLLGADVPPDSLQFQVAIAVNKDGVVGVSWYDTRHVPDGSGFDEYFAASVDGGKSFLPPVRVSSESSRFVGQGNMRMDPIVFGHKDELYLSLLSAGSRWGGGGDYMGLAAGADGAFFPFWADSRTGTFQMYTARIAVEVPPKEGKSADKPASPGAATRTAVSLKDRVELVFDPTRFDMARSEAEIPIRLRNVSREPIYPPITLEITAFDYDDPEIAKSDAPPPQIVNAANGQNGAGAKFDFSGALGNLEVLPPGGLTGPVFARFHFEDPLKTGPIRIRLEGMVESP